MQEIVTLLEELSIPDDRDIHIWVEDEHRYGLMSVIRRCWTMKGHRAVHNDKYECTLMEQQILCQVSFTPRQYR